MNVAVDERLKDALAFRDKHIRQLLDLRVTTGIISPSRETDFLPEINSRARVRRSFPPKGYDICSGLYFRPSPFLWRLLNDIRLMWILFSLWKYRRSLGHEKRVRKYKRITESSIPWINLRRLERHSRLGHFLCRPYLEKTKTAINNHLPFLSEKEAKKKKERKKERKKREEDAIKLCTWVLTWKYISFDSYLYHQHIGSVQGNSL